MARPSTATADLIYSDGNLQWSRVNTEPETGIHMKTNNTNQQDANNSNCSLALNFVNASPAGPL